MGLSEDRTKFWKQIRLTDYECDQKGKIKLSYILRHMQEISGEHLEEIGLPYMELYRQGQVFLLSKMDLTVSRRPEMEEVVTFYTSPKQPIGAQYIRCNDVVDAKGEIILHADTSWLLVDPESRRILRPKDFVGQLPLNETFDKKKLQDMKIPMVSVCEEAGEREIRYSDLDVNRHMNNAAYADVIFDYLPDEVSENQEPSFLRIHFQNEALLHERLRIFRAQMEDQSWYLSAEKQSGKCFEAWIKFD